MDVFDADAVAVNGRFLGQRVTGVQRFAIESLRCLAALRPVSIVVPHGVEIPSDLEGANVIHVGRGAGHVWEQVHLPLFLRRRGSPLLLNLASTAPVSYHNQIVTHHDITYVRFPESFSWRFRLLYAAIVPRFLKNSLRVLTVSDFSRDEISDHYRIPRSKIHVVPNGVSDYFRQSFRYDSQAVPYALAVSSPNAHKNIARLVDAFRDIDRLPIDRLVVVGAQSRSFSQQSYAIPPSVEFVGGVDDATLRELYAGAEVFVFPSLYEGFGIPPLEAQAAGTPVAASTAASIPEVLGQSAIYFDPHDVTDIRAAIQSIVSDKQLAARLRAEGQDNVLRYTWSRSASLISSVIDSVTLPESNEVV